MNTKKRNHMVMSVEIITGEIRRWNSISQAAKAIDVSVVTITRSVKQVKATHGYVFCEPGDEHRAVDLADYLRKNGYVSSKSGRPKKAKQQKVWLRIDSHTSILVKPEEATPEFAIKYLKKLKRYE